MPPLEHGPVPAVPEVSVTASPARRALFGSGVVVNAVNNSLFPMICKFEARSATGSRPLDPEFVWIDAQTAAELNLRVPLRIPPSRSVAVNVYHPASTLAYETAVRTPLIFLLGLLVVVAALASGTGFALVHRSGSTAVQTQVLALSAPPAVIAGDSVQVRYATQGADRVHYAIARSGRTVQSADVPSGTGTFAFRAGAPGTYHITLQASGAGGTRDSSQDVQARATPAPQRIAAISSLSVDPPVAQAGSTIRVHYASSGTSGAVRLVDDSGVPWAAQRWNREGVTTLRAPNVTAPRRFIITLAVASGKSAASAQTALLVVPPQPPATPSATRAPATPAPAPTTAMATAVSVQTVPSYVASGEYFQIVVQGAPAEAIQRIALQNANGTVVAAHDASELHTLFVAPIVARTTRYSIVVTLTQNRAGGLIVQPLDIHAR